MEKTLNLGAFETLDQQEMMEVDGGKNSKNGSWKGSFRNGLRMWVSGPMWYSWC